jgi:hypothetical protein
MSLAREPRRRFLMEHTMNHVRHTLDVEMRIIPEDEPSPAYLALWRRLLAPPPVPTAPSSPPSPPDRKGASARTAVDRPVAI